MQNRGTKTTQIIHHKLKYVPSLKTEEVGLFKDYDQLALYIQMIQSAKNVKDKLL